MDSSGTDYDIGDEHLFDGVRFFLVGFESDVESQWLISSDGIRLQYRSEMEVRGGADAGSLGNGCTHVVVSNLFYDDPTCVAARAEGKKVVIDQWVEDSLDRGVLADVDRVIYWPVRHSNGIPGAQSLLICLTELEEIRN
uniref:BRCT domain-containing protein n=1 Tax=Setaria italica TaxID=4555 RepID=K4AL59_SETIT